MLPFVEIFGREIGLYSIMTMCGILTAGFYACRTAAKQKYDYSQLILLILVILAGAIIGSHLLYAMINYKDIVTVFQNLEKIDSFKKAIDIFKYLFGGSVFYGGLIGGLLAGLIYTVKDEDNKKYIDIVAVNIPLFHAFARVGCFLGGCCFGIPCKLGFTYTISPLEEANNITRFPVQLFEAFFNLILFILLNQLFKKEKFKNKLLFVYLALYASGRFFIEFLRGDSYRGIWGYLSTSQIISIIIILFVLTVQLINRRHIKASCEK